MAGLCSFPADAARTTFNFGTAKDRRGAYKDLPEKSKKALKKKYIDEDEAFPEPFDPSMEKQTEREGKKGKNGGKTGLRYERDLRQKQTRRGIRLHRKFSKIK